MNVNQGFTLTSNAKNRGMYIVSPLDRSRVCWGDANDFPINATRPFTTEQLSSPQFSPCKNAYNEFGVLLVGAHSGLTYGPFVIKSGQSCTVNYSVFKGMYLTC